MNTLIVDDNEMTRTLLRTILSSNGHTIMGEASNSGQGLEQALSLKPDIIFLDIQMPDGNGIDLLRRIVKELPATAVLMVTGNRDTDTVKNCHAIGAKGFIVKPFNAAAVLKAMSEATRRTGTRDQLPGALPGDKPRVGATFINISNLKIRTRLGAAFGFLVLVAVMLAAAGSWGLHLFSEATERMVHHGFGKERLISEWRHATNLNGARTMAIARNADGSEQEAVGSKIKETSARISEIQKQLDAMPTNPAEKALHAEIAAKRKEYLAAREEVFSAKKSGGLEDAKKLADTRLEPALGTYVAAIQRLSDLQNEEISRRTDEVNKQFWEGQVVLGILASLALLFSVGFAVWISRSITKPLQQAIEVSRAVAKGDLTTNAISVNGSDELSELLWCLRHMNENLGVLVGQVRAGADSIAVASGHIASGSLNLSTRTEEQASSLEETASTMEELTSTVKQNADHARQANEMAESASEVAIKGGAVVSQVVQTMGAIHESSKRIADIISVIDGIAFQTNILALNAAVEAARAGEQGRGFAVVAAEVRSLAQRSAAAAKEIAGLISDSVENVEAGGKLVSQAGATMDEIVANIKKVTDVVGEITIASREQSSGIEQIGDSINHLDKMTQQNASLVENSLTATQGMEEQARGLVDIVSVFKLDHSHEGNAGTMSTQPHLAGKSRGTPREAIGLVKRAIAFRKDCPSLDGFLRGVTDRTNKFFDRDMYVFALDEKGIYRAFGGNPDKVGTRVQDISGVDGEKLLQAIIAQGKEGPGWVEYEISNPLTKKVQSKMSYIELLDGVYIGCGVYTSLI